MKTVKVHLIIGATLISFDIPAKFNFICYTGHGSLLCIRTTSQLNVVRERPLRITYSLYFENIMNYYFYLKHIREGE